jgi:uncharacterized protein
MIALEIYKLQPISSSHFVQRHDVVTKIQFFVIIRIKVRSILHRICILFQDCWYNMNPYLPNKISDLVELLQLIPHPEGGFFRETHRSGCVPMSSRGLTDTTPTLSYATSRSLVHATNTSTASTASTALSANNENKGDMNDGSELVIRNAITSIYWVPSLKSPKLILSMNLSDHVHYFQGGGYAFVYYIYTPATNTFRVQLLGPNILKGHQLQVFVSSGEWKCGHMVSLDTTINKMDDVTCNNLPIPSVSSTDTPAPEYLIIGEGVGPGFDVNDFAWITETEIDKAKFTLEEKSFLKQFLHADRNVATNKEQDFDRYYDNNDSTHAERV